MKNILLLLFISSFVGNVKSQTNYYTANDAEVKVKGGTLYGTLFTPTGIKNPPVVLLIAGSGPTDRDGNTPLMPGKNWIATARN
jgi:hypothetical protein